jgi:energy-coupling factor transporter ATP-binding protein EcfA2
MKHHVEASVRIADTFKTRQVCGMFDLTFTPEAKVSFDVELPSLDESWQIGAIVGPSGSGKSTIARHAYARELYEPQDWPSDRSVVEGFGDIDVREITSTLTSVGFSSPPAWIKPYQVLSNGEKFRCDLARSLLSDQSLVVFDEFTSVVDRTVAQIGSAALAKAIRRESKRRFVAVTCHYDILPWLQPDWWLDMASGKLARGQLRRPSIELSIRPVQRAAWSLFAKHHYLDHAIAPAAKCFGGFVDGQIVCFMAWLRDHLASISCKATVYRGHRLVVLPDWQGVGIGGRMIDATASIVAHQTDQRLSVVSSHPALSHHMQRSKNWCIDRAGYVAPTARGGKIKQADGKTINKKKFNAGKMSCTRYTVSARYVGPKLDAALAAKLWDEPRISSTDRDVLAAIVARPGCAESYLARKTALPPAELRAAIAKLIQEKQITKTPAQRGVPATYHASKLGS